MDYSEENIKRLIKGHFDKSLSDSEWDHLCSWVNANDQNGEIMADMVKKEILESQMCPPPPSTDRALRKLMVEIKIKQSNRTKKLWISSVAASLVLLAISSLLFFANHSDKGGPSHNNPTPDKISLTLSDGSVILLGEENIKNDVRNGFVRITDKKKVSYKAQGFQSLKEEFNTIRVPKGKRFSLQLSDGSLIYLNSGTEVRYPVVFKGNERNIELINGEIYCEISKRIHKPFYLNAQRIRVRVLGTAFNFSSYSNEKKHRAVLVEGSVAIAPRNSFGFDLTKASKLKPGQAFIYNTVSKRFKVKDVNTDTFTAWKEGRLVFKSMPLNEILPRISRWYGVDIIDRTGEIGNNTFNGTFDKENLDEALVILSKLCGVHYKKVGGKVIVGSNSLD
ncbi:hypothetical protein FUAX_41550 (plasmid) [Fulvitalea axinellae]|uniref:FecR family protein n=1 Tax=Fulvitalea axinellae TaxID=1182444 RepID=A0AAU9D6U1_9BACT|nr:hypothetical protein FUAX_41550 [Fulvitalea axinellae]